jgi:RimJ/RimL family protein N-acetyltransferase
MTERVRLRPVTEDDFTVLQKVTQHPETTGEFSWIGWYSPQGWRQRWDDENGLIGLDGGTLMVVRDDEPVGMVTWRRRQTGPVAHCWITGIALVPEARGHGYGTEAQRLLLRYLFEHTTVHRIEAITEVDNIAEQRALEKAGFLREGVMRGEFWRSGAWRDTVIYGILRTDPQV